MKFATPLWVVLLLGITQVGLAQPTIYDLLDTNDLRTTGLWFGASEVVLGIKERLPDRPDTTGLSREQLEAAYIKYAEEMHKKWGEFIHLNPEGKIIYKYLISCPVGELLYDVKTFNVNGDQLYVEYSKYPWNETPVYEGATYAIVYIGSYAVYLKKI
ncbi:MAG: hypothetical protein GC178_00810 [Flavobacteriales bacterium]|nr:hypothetical protein [Flavobacteriales bacterium]